MGFLTEDEIQSLRIIKMILNVVREGEDFVPEPERAVEEEPFFIARIRETNAAAVHRFMEESPTKERLQQIASGELDFESGCHELSSDFASRHVGTSSEGAFFIFELETANPGVKIYSLVKYDYREVVEQTSSEDGASLLRRIVHAFIADKRAMQKSALVRVVGGVADYEISASDRIKAGPDISEYFAKFLRVTRDRSDEELNRTLAIVLLDSLKENREFLPNGDVARALQHAKDVLRDRQEVTEEAIQEAIAAAAGHPDDENVRSRLRATALRKIRAARLEGLSFAPNPQVLRRPPTRKVSTAEGVTLTYPDDIDATTVRRERRAEGGEVITIETERITEDTFVRERTR